MNAAIQKETQQKLEIRERERESQNDEARNYDVCINFLNARLTFSALCLRVA